ncbi:MAG: hypothetical protein NT157_05185 [Candidatus Micrarchaeota archaeon]|nr:hypothetical protein [Candidatus Micrarchaeota archaeon]
MPVSMIIYSYVPGSRLFLMMLLIPAFLLFFIFMLIREGRGFFRQKEVLKDASREGGSYKGEYPLWSPEGESLSGSHEGVEYKITRINLSRSRIYIRRRIENSFWWTRIKIYSDKPPFYSEILGMPGRTAFDPLTRFLNDVMWLPYTFGRRWHGNFLIKSNDERAAVEFCNRNAAELESLIKINVVLPSRCEQVPLRAEINKGNFRMSFSFIVYEGDKEKIKEVLSSVAAIAKRES